MTLALRSAAIAVAALLAATPASSAEKRFGLTSFDTIEVTTDVVVEVVARAPVSAMATGSQEALDRLDIEARGGRLVIGQRKFAGDEKRRAPQGIVTIRVHAANLRSVTLVGAGSIQVDALKGQRVTIGLRGPGQIKVGQITTDRLSVATIGNGSIQLGGSAKQAQITMSGAVQVDASALKIDELISDSEGAGDHVFHAVKSATITSRGVGKTVVLGRPTCTVRAVGSGPVTCGTAK